MCERVALGWKCCARVQTEGNANGEVRAAPSLILDPLLQVPHFVAVRSQNIEKSSKAGLKIMVTVTVTVENCGGILSTAKRGYVTRVMSHYVRNISRQTRRQRTHVRARDLGCSH